MWYVGAVFGLILCGLATAVSQRMVNAVVLSLGPVVLLDFIGSGIYANTFGEALSLQTIITIIGLYFSFHLPFCIAYIRFQGSRDPRQIRIAEVKTPSAKRVFSINLIALAIASILITNLSFRSGQGLFTRELYEETRNGYGPYYFGAQLLCLISISLSASYLSGTLMWLTSLVALSLVASLGAKGPIVLGILLFALPKVVQPIVKIRQVFTIGIVSILLTFGAGYTFYLYTPWARDDLGIGLISYLDAPRNLGMLIEKWERYRLGQLVIEDNLYVAMPKALFPAKPVAWGSSVLSDEMFRVRAIDKGAPSFTRFGRFWADFGYISILPLFALGYILGRYAAMAEDSIARRPTIFMTCVFLITINQSYLNPGLIVFTVCVLNLAVARGLEVLLGGTLRLHGIALRG